MAKKYLDYDGLLYFWQKIKANFVTDITYNSSSRKIQKTKAGTSSDVVTLATVATSGSYDDLSNKPTIPTGVSPSTTTPKMDGTANVGSETLFARGDHVHPTDTSRASSDDLDNLAGVVDGKVDKVTGKGLSTNDYTTTEKNKLSGIASGAEVNQNAFSNVKVGSTTIAADSKTDTLTLTAGSNVTLTPDATNDKVTIAATDTTYSDATSGTHGLMSAADKIKLDATIAQGVYVDDWADVDSSDLFAVLEPYSGSQSFTVIGESAIGAANGVCPLNASSKVDATYLPSYVDDVIEAYPRSGQTELSQNWLATGSASGTVITPEAGKIYVLMADSTSYSANSQFRWGGTAYVKMNDGGVSSITNGEIDTIVAS